MTFLPWKVMEWVNIIKEALLHWNTFKGVLFFSFLYFQCALCLFNLFSVKLQSNKLIHMFPPSAFLFFIYTLFFLRVFIFFVYFLAMWWNPNGWKLKTALLMILSLNSSYLHCDRIIYLKNSTPLFLTQLSKNWLVC